MNCQDLPGEVYVTSERAEVCSVDNVLLNDAGGVLEDDSGNPLVWK